jgi:hypothetical protein
MPGGWATLFLWDINTGTWTSRLEGESQYWESRRRLEKDRWRCPAVTENY